MNYASEPRRLIVAITGAMPSGTGLDKFELNMVQQWNDAYNGRPENRYAHVLGCVRWRANDDGT